MPTFSPQFSFWFGVAVTILIGIGGGTVQLTGMIPEAWIKPVDAWVDLLAFIGSTILTAMHGLSSVGPGPLAPPPTVQEAHEVMQQARAAQ